MKIILDHDGETVNATVPDKGDNRFGTNWVAASREAAYGWAVHKGCGTVTARESDGEAGNPRIVSVTVEYHDE